MRHKILRFVPILMAISALAFGCSAPRVIEPPEVQEVQPEPPVHELVFMRCGTLDILIEPVSAHRLILSTSTLTLEMTAVPSASGAKYEAADDGFSSFWSKGETATLVLRNQVYPECYTTEPIHLPYRATGNEPGWRLDITEHQLILSYHYGAGRLSAPKPPAQVQRGAKVRYEVTEKPHSLRVDIEPQICVDTMTGMPSPHRVSLYLDGEELQGCGGDPHHLLQDRQWRVREIGGESVPENLQVTLAFGPERRLQGRAPCNRFAGTYHLSAEGLLIQQVAATKVACPPATMQLEQLFFSLLEGVSRFEMGSDARLTLHSAQGSIIAD